MGNDFKKARLKLVLLYLCIVGGVVGLFSFLTIYQAKDSFSDPAVLTDKEIVVSAMDAIKIAQTREPGKTIAETEYEIEAKTLLFTVAFDDESEVKVNLLTGEVFTPTPAIGLIRTLADDFDEKVLWIALFVFLFASLLSVYVANRTLYPIAQNIEKQKQFVSGAAHELRNPLAALRTRIESVLRGGEADVKSDVLPDLLQETNQLITLSESLLTLEKSERNPNNVTMKIERVEQVLNRVLERLKHLAHHKGVTVETDIGLELIRIDTLDLETILYNLIHNAIKFTNRGGVIRVTWRNSILVVSDTGIGIPPLHLDHIFDRFYKVDSARGQEGSGLGLAIVSEIVAKYGATINVSSAHGEGTTFTIQCTERASGSLQLRLLL